MSQPPPIGTYALSQKVPGEPSILPVRERAKGRGNADEDTVLVFRGVRLERPGGYRVSMQFCIDVPNFGAYGEPDRFLQLARAVEEGGWDGLSLWDHILVSSGTVVADPWALLSAAATVTKQIKLITMVTPLPRRRPWVVSRQAVTVDRLSQGRLVLGVGIGYPPGPEFATFGEQTREVVRAEMLDEGLAILDGMWSGRPFAHHGAHYRMEEAAFAPRPVQQPRIPIWVAGMWPNRGPFRRSARWDGVAPLWLEGDRIRPPKPDDIREMLDYVHRFRSARGGFDVAVGLALPDDRSDQRQLVSDMAEAGATWIRSLFNPAEPIESFLEWVRSGPPK